MVMRTAASSYDGASPLVSSAGEYAVNGVNGVNGANGVKGVNGRVCGAACELVVVLTMSVRPDKDERSPRTFNGVGLAYSFRLRASSS